MKHQYRMYGWPASMFSGKLRGYLNYKGLDYEEKSVSAYDVLYRLPRAIDAMGMPAVKVDTGEWLGDTPVIIDELERRHAENAIGIDTPRQRMASLLLENWFDDAWAKVALHTRWSYPENWNDLIKDEWGTALVPYAPFIGRRIATKMGQQGMNNTMRAIGVRGKKRELIERWALTQLDALNAHFSQHSYLFGGRPTGADYSCLGVMHPHLNRDPWPRREWMNARPALQSWVERTHSGKPPTGELLAKDEIPSSLSPLFRSVFAEFAVYIEAAVDRLESLVAKESLVSGSALPRLLEDVTYPALDSELTGMPMTYSIWRQQRMQKQYRALSTTEQESVDTWCTSMGRADLFTMNLGPELKRVGFGAALA